MIKKVLIGFVIIFLTFGALLPSILRTLEWGQCTSDLIVLMTLEKDDIQWNPWNEDFFWIRPGFAEYLLSNYDFPDECNSPLSRDPPMPPLHVLLASRIGDPLDATDPRLLRLLVVFIERGEPIDEYDEGHPPLHKAILYNDVPAARVLLESGADPMLPIDYPGRKHHGMTAFEFLDWLVVKWPEMHEEMAVMVKGYEEAFAVTRIGDESE